MENRITRIENDLRKIEERNNRVELDKAWETSLTRKVLIAVTTYLPMGLYMQAIGVSQPWLNAIVPTLGFLLSTLAFPWIKKKWINQRIKDRK